MYVTVDEYALPVYADNSFLYNSLIYFGNSTTLAVKWARRLLEILSNIFFITFYTYSRKKPYLVVDRGLTPLPLSMDMSTTIRCFFMPFLFHIRGLLFSTFSICSPCGSKSSFKSKG